MPAPIGYKRPHLYAKQTAFVDCPARYAIVEAATKTGKTVACLVWLFEKAISGSAGQNYWWIAPTYAVAGIAFNRLKQWLIAPGGLPRPLWRARESQQAVEFTNGTKIWFKGADKPDSLFGEDVFAAVIDEATRCKADAWHAVRSTLTATGGPVKIIGNVRGRKNWAYVMAREAEAGGQDMAYFKLTAYDAVEGGVLNVAEVEDAKRRLPEGIFRELYLAEPSDDGGNPFGLTAIRSCIVPTLSTAPTVAYGVDLAKSRDWTAVVGLDEYGHATGIWRWQSDWNQTRRRVLDIVGEVPTLVDSTGVGDPIVEDFRRERWNVEGLKFSATSKQQLMEGLSAAIQRSEIHFPEGWLVDELETFEYEYREGGVRYSAPEGLHDDGVCSIALAMKKLTDTKGREIEVRLLGGDGPRPDPAQHRQRADEWANRQNSRVNEYSERGWTTIYSQRDRDRGWNN